MLKIHTFLLRFDYFEFHLLAEGVNPMSFDIWFVHDRPLDDIFGHEVFETDFVRVIVCENFAQHFPGGLLDARSRALN